MKHVALSLSLSSSGLSSPLLSLDAEEFDKPKLADLIYRNVHQGIVATGRPSVAVDDLFRIPLDGCYSAWRGWRVTRRLTENLLEVTRSGLTVTTTLDRWREVEGDCGHGNLIVDSAFPNLIPGWFTIGGATMLREGGRRWRTYCNVDEVCAVSVAMHLKELLDRLDVPFLMKIARSIGAETRSDSLVVEFNDDRLEEVIGHLYQASAGTLRLRSNSRVSPFARRVGHGITVARSHSDPSVSFGMWASSVFAESLLDCLTKRGMIEWEHIVELLAERGTEIWQFELST
ncbi:MAG: T3SS effector HopA1 family protein [Chloroflexota bacterium]|nr:T3SS effector HopA1 family protein [Chloroflexota bacterium]